MAWPYVLPIELYNLTKPEFQLSSSLKSNLEHITPSPASTQQATQASGHQPRDWPNGYSSNIIFPTMLARYLACSLPCCAACWSWIRRPFSFAWGTAILPCVRLMSNPSQEHCCEGSQQHFDKLITKPALFRSSCMARPYWPLRRLAHL